MKNNEKMNINIILYITAIGIIFSTIFFIYNAAQTKYIESVGAEQDEKEEVQTNEEVEIAKVETQEVSSRKSMNDRQSTETQTENNQTEQIEATNQEQNQEPENIEPEKTYTQIKDVKISKDMDLTVSTNLSKEDFKTVISGVKQDTSKFFYNNSDLIYDLCQKYELNEIFFCGLISAESGWKIADNHRRTHNYISLMSKGNLLKYNSVEEGLEVAAKTLHNKYLTKGGVFYYGKTLSAVKTKFCPASSTWVNLVYGRMKQII
mgnify:FL=1